MNNFNALRDIFHTASRDSGKNAEHAQDDYGKAKDQGATRKEKKDAWKKFDNAREDANSYGQVSNAFSNASRRR